MCSFACAGPAPAHLRCKSSFFSRHALSRKSDLSTYIPSVTQQAAKQHFLTPGGGFGPKGSVAISREYTDILPLPRHHFANCGRSSTVQMGVFARRHIPAGTVLGMYGGRYLTGDEADNEHEEELKPNPRRTEGPSINDCLLDISIGGKDFVIDGAPKAFHADGAKRDEPERRRYWGGLINAAPRGTGEDAANSVFVRATRGSGFKAGPLRKLQLPIIFCVASRDISSGDEVRARPPCPTPRHALLHPQPSEWEVPVMHLPREEAL